MWKEKRGWCGTVGQSGFLSSYFFSKGSPSPGGSISVVWPRGMLWTVVTEHQSTQRGAAPKEEVVLHCLEWWHKGWEFVWQGLTTPCPCCCCSPGMALWLFMSCRLSFCFVCLFGERIDSSTGMLFGVSGSFNSPWILWLIASAIGFGVWRQHCSHVWWEGTKLIFLFSSFEHFF